MSPSLDFLLDRLSMMSLAEALELDLLFSTAFVIALPLRKLRNFGLAKVG